MKDTALQEARITSSDNPTMTSNCQAACLVTPGAIRKVIPTPNSKPKPGQTNVSFLIE